jgi:pimeloyl-ACP methyl ester carboxylesterase
MLMQAKLLECGTRKVRDEAPMTKILIAALSIFLFGTGVVRAQFSTSVTTTYHTIEIDGVHIFYREAGTADAPTLLLLHGYPSSSQEFDTLIPLLADRYHIIAPDYPAFGHSDAPPPASFAYTFDHVADVIDRMTEKLGLAHYVLYMNDYGGPVGFRLAVKHPDRVRAMIVQNAVSSDEGLGPAWGIRRAYWNDRAAYEDKVIGDFTSLEGAKERHIGSSPHPERYNPDTWTDEFAILSRPGERQIQADLFFDYQTNVASYPKWQEWIRQHQPPLLVVWGRYDPSFALAGADIYKQCVPSAEVHILDAGHFTLDEAVDQIAAIMRPFLQNKVPGLRSPAK